MGCVVAVHQMDPIIVERFGKFERIARPGLLCLPVPCIISAAGSVNLRTTEATVHVDTKTKDNVFVRIDVCVQYAAIDTDQAIYDAYYKLTDPIVQLTAYVDDAVRSFVPHSLELDELFESKEQVADHVEKTLEKEMEVYGYRIAAALVTNIIPEASVREEMNSINANKRLRQATQESAEGAKYLQIKHAEADSQASFLQGEGVARQRKAIVDGLKTSVDGFAEDVTEMTAKEVLDLMLITQYLDAVSCLATSKTSKLVMTYKRGKKLQVSEAAMKVRAAAAKAKDPVLARSMIGVSRMIEEGFEGQDGDVPAPLKQTSPGSGFNLFNSFRGQQTTTSPPNGTKKA